MRRQKGLETRRALLAAAIDSVAHFGMAGTTLHVVAINAGVSRALVGLHFDTKEQLLIEALEFSLETYDASLIAVLDCLPDDPAGRVRAHIMHDVAFATKHPELLSLWCSVWGEARGVALYQRLMLPADRRYRENLARDLRLVLPDAERADRAAVALDALVYGLWIHAHLDPENYDCGRASEAASSMLDATLSAGKVVLRKRRAAD